MSIPGSKTGRRERHLALQTKQRDRKRLRRQRADIHAAMCEAEGMRKRAKQGQSKFDRFMRELGYEPKTMVRGNDRCIISGREIPGDVMAKYERVT